VKELAAAVVALAAASQQCMADSDTLKPLSFATFPAAMRHQLDVLNVRDPIKRFGCLPGDKNKRTVCTFRIGDIMQIMASSAKGGADMTELTIICTAGNPMDSSKCLRAYAAAISVTTPEVSDKDRGKIISLLIEALPVGNLMSIETEERKFTLQKSMGLWFTVEAADEAE